MVIAPRRAKMIYPLFSLLNQLLIVIVILEEIGFTRLKNRVFRSLIRRLVTEFYELKENGLCFKDKL